MREHSEDLVNERQARLDELPELAPPASSRERVLAAMAGAARYRMRAPARRGRLAMAAAVGALTVGAALLGGYALIELEPGGGAADPGTGVPIAGRDLVGPVDAIPYADATQEDLLEASRQLELLLGELPAQRRLMRVGTASTIAALEDQIALIDARLSFVEASGVEPEVEQTLWRDRVDAMSALVQIRYGQSQLFAY